MIGLIVGMSIVLEMNIKNPAARMLHGHPKRPSLIGNQESNSQSTCTYGETGTGRRRECEHERTGRGDVGLMPGPVP